MPEFGVSIERVGDTQVVGVRGEVDLDTAQRFAEGLQNAARHGHGAVVVDLSGVEFMDSTGLHLLLNLLRRLTRQGRRLALACGNSGVQRLFELTRLDGTFELYGSRDEALAAVDGRGRRVTT